MKRTVDVPKKTAAEDEFSSSDDDDEDISVATGLCKSYKDCVRWRGNRLFSFCGTTQVCALCLTSNINAKDEKDMNLTKHIDLGRCNAVRKNFGLAWDEGIQKLRCPRCLNPLKGKTQTYTRLFSHYINCASTKFAKKFACAWPNCRKNKNLTEIPRHMLKHLHVNATPLKCKKLINVQEKIICSKINKTAYTCDQQFETFANFLAHIEPIHKCSWQTQNVRQIQTYFEVGLTTDELTTFKNRTTLFVLHKTNYKNLLKGEKFA